MQKGNNEPGLFQGILLAYFILLLHVLLIASLGILIIFFKGLVTFWPLIVLAGVAFLGGSTYYVFRHFKAGGKGPRGALNSQLLSGKSIEVSLLGGAASIKIHSRNGGKAVPAIGAGDRSPLKDPESARIQALLAQAKQLECDYYNPETHQKTQRNLHS